MMITPPELKLVCRYQLKRYSGNQNVDFTTVSSNFSAKSTAYYFVMNKACCSEKSLLLVTCTKIVSLQKQQGIVDLKT